jgi:hypothetical protein
MARVFVSEPFARIAEGLAWVSGRDDIHLAAPSSAVEGGKIRPDRRPIQGRIIHPRHESGCGVCVPLAPANSFVSGYCERQSKFKPSGPGRQGDSRTLSGRYSHIYFPFRFSWSSGLGLAALTWLIHPHRGHLIAKSSAVPLPNNLLQLPQRICGVSLFSIVKGSRIAPRITA